MRNTAAIVVTYNRCEMLRQCLDALIKSTLPVDIYIIDNASADQTAEVARAYVDGEHVRYFNTGANLGGAGGFNYGLKQAYKNGHAYYWLMDDDTIVNEDAHAELMAAAGHIGKGFGFLSGLALWTDGSPCRMNKQIVIPEYSVWNEEKKLCQEGIVRIERATFVSFLLSREALEDKGLPISEYFIWGDDTEYSLRISRSWPCYFVSRSVVVHRMKDNRTTARLYEYTDPERITRLGYSVRNDACTYRRMGRKRLGKYTRRMLREVMDLIRKPSPHKSLLLKTVVKGYFTGLFRFKPEIERVEA